MYKPGDHWLLCDQCQRKMRFSQSTKRWDGLIVHRDPSEGCWETRHPQDFVRPVKDNFPLPVVRPDNDGIDGAFTPHSIISTAAWAVIPTGTFEPTDYDVVPPSDEFFSDVVALLHMEDTTDVIGHTFTKFGTVTFETNPRKFGEKSAEFTGGSYLTSANSADWDFGTGDFTIEGWIKI